MNEFGHDDVIPAFGEAEARGAILQGQPELHSRTNAPNKEKTQF